MDVHTLFNTYVFDWMVSDLEKALEAARTERDAKREPYGRHFLALALLQYSEFMGSLEANQYNLTTFTQKFKHFLVNWMGGAYGIIVQNNDVYWDFRSGLVHQFFVQPGCTIILFNDSTAPFTVHGTPSSKVARPADGLGRAPNGNYYIVIEQYLEDFKNACQSLYAHLSQPKLSPTGADYSGWPDIGTTGGLGDSG